MKKVDLKFIFSVIIVMVCMAYASKEKDVILRSLSVSLAIISITMAFKGLSSMGLGRDHD